MNARNKVFSLAAVVSVMVSILTAVSCNQATEERKARVNQANKVTVYPHGPEFSDNHGKEFRAHANQCFRCHGNDLSGGTSKVSCKSCHGNSFPHPAEWALPQGHGEAFARLDEESRSQCLKCHMVGNDKANRTVGCYGCHTAYPHDQLNVRGFKTGRHAKLASSFEGKCINCHGGDYKKNMPTMPETGCLDCHSGDLKIEWKDAHHKKTETRQPTSAAKPKK